MTAIHITRAAWLIAAIAGCILAGILWHWLLAVVLGLAFAATCRGALACADRPLTISAWLFILVLVLGLVAVLDQARPGQAMALAGLFGFAACFVLLRVRSHPPPQR